MMEHERQVTVKIEDMSQEGQGIGRADGMVVFVPGTVVGDVVLAQLTKIKKNFAFSRLVEIVEPSQHRGGEFDCDFYGKGCGGCPYGALSYDAQLALKERQVRDKLQRLAGLEKPLVRPIIGMAPEDNDGLGSFRYRNKAQFPVSTGGIITRKGGIVENLGSPVVGFYRAKSHEVVDCEDCYLQSMAAMAAADALRQFMKEDNITAYDPKWDKGLLRHLIVKTAFATGEVMVILVINGKGIPGVQKLVDMLDDAIYDVGFSLESVVMNIKKGGSVDSGAGKKKNAKKAGKKKNGNLGQDPVQLALSGEIMGEENVVVAGKPVIRDVMGHLEFEISPASFYQVNPVQMKRLYDQVRTYCGLEDQAEVSAASKPVILDLYCGVGSIGLYCADGAEMVIGIESVKEAVLDANRNAVINGIVNARYLCGRAEEVLPKYAAAGRECGIYDIEEKPEKVQEDNVDGEKIDMELAAYIGRTDIAILDPPRAGCKPELLEAVAAVGVERIVYVSCDPATLARDIKLLSGLGYAFVEATPCDLFPWTGHVECVSLLQKVK